MHTYVGHGACYNRACPRNASIALPPMPITEPEVAPQVPIRSRPGFIDPYTWERIAPIIALWKPPIYLTPDVVGELLQIAVQTRAQMYVGMIHVLGKAHIQEATAHIGDGPILDLTQFNISRHRENMHLTGLDPICRAHIINSPDAKAILIELMSLVDYPVAPPAFGIMCHGGRHRAPSFAIFLQDLVMHRANMTFYNAHVARRLFEDR